MVCVVVLELLFVELRFSSGNPKRLWFRNMAGALRSVGIGLVGGFSADPFLE